MSYPIDLSIIIPALNEEAVIGSTLEQLADYVRSHPELGHVEVVVVAAGTDQTPAIAKRFTHRFPALTVITPPSRAGKGRDVRLGFQAAHGTYQLFTDADLSTPLHYIQDAVKLLKTGEDIVIGRRNLSRIHSGAVRPVVSVMGNRVIRTLILPGIHDSQCGFKAFNGKVARQLFNEQRIDGWAFDVEVLAMARHKQYRVAELPITDWREMRDAGLRSDSVIGTAVSAFQDVLQLRMRLWLDSLSQHSGACIAIAAGISFALALGIGTRQSFWFDEAYTAALIQHSFAGIAHYAALDVHPPFYYFLLKAWAGIFGNHDIALRSFSALCSSAALGVGLLLVRRIWGAKSSIIALPFAVAAPFAVRYGFEVRMYALASLICIAATYVLVWAQQTRRRLLWVAYALLLAAGLYTLYYTALVWVAHFMWCVYDARVQQPRTKWRDMYRQGWLLSFGAAILAFTPWLPTVLRQLHYVQHGFWIPPVTFRTITMIGSLFFLYRAEWQLDAEWALLFFAAIALSGYFVVRAYQHTPATLRSHMVLLMLYIAVPIFMLYAASLPPLQPIFIERYVSHAILAGYLLLGIGVARTLRARPTLWNGLAALSLLAILVTGTATLARVGNYNFNELDAPTARSIAAYLSASSAPSQPIITDGPTSYLQLYHYLPHSNLLFYSQQPTLSYGGFAMLHDSARRISTTRPYQGQSVWVVYIDTKPAFIPQDDIPARGTQIGRFRAYLYSPFVTQGL